MSNHLREAEERYRVEARENAIGLAGALFVLMPFVILFEWFCRLRDRVHALKGKLHL